MGVSVCVFGVSVCVLGVSVCVLGVSVCVLGVSVCVLGVSICVLGVSVCVLGVSVCVLGVSVCVNFLVYLYSYYGWTAEVFDLFVWSLFVTCLFNTRDVFPTETKQFTNLIDLFVGRPLFAT